MKIELEAIGRVHSDRTEHASTGWRQVRAHIELSSSFNEEALRELGTFSHLVVVFYMHRVDRARIERSSRHPQNNAAWPRVGIFAQRGKNRPNQLGVTVCRIERAEGTRVYVSGLDALDGTPVLDLKPWFAEYGPGGEVIQPSWVAEMMHTYWGST